MACDSALAKSRIRAKCQPQQHTTTAQNRPTHTATTTATPHHHRRRLYTRVHLGWRHSPASGARPTHKRAQGQDSLSGHPASMHGAVAAARLPTCLPQHCGQSMRARHLCGLGTWQHACQAAQVSHNLELACAVPWCNSDAACLWVHTSIRW